MPDDTVLIVEDHHLLADAVAAALADHGVRSRAAEPDTLAQLVETVEPGTLVLLDLRLGHGRDGGRAVAPLVRRGARVVVVTGTSDPEPLAQALEDGALTVLDKHRPFSELVDVIVAIRDGKTPAHDERRAAILHAAAQHRADRQSAAAVLERLTERESQVLDLLCTGLNAQQIADDAGVAPTTVRAQIRSVLLKLGARSQLQAVALAQDLRRRAGRRRPSARSASPAAGRRNGTAG